MRQSALFRFAALFVGLLVSLAAPALALAHGVTHRHLAHEQAAAGADDGDHGHAGTDDHAGRTLAPAEHRHDHGHAILDVAPGARSVGHVDAVAPVVAEVPLSCAATHVRVVVPPACTDAAVLPRPAPAEGAPSSPRAPPAR